MNYIVAELFNGTAITHVGPFPNWDAAQDWIDRQQTVPPNELGIDKFVRESKVFIIYNLLRPA